MIRSQKGLSLPISLLFTLLVYIPAQGQENAHISGYFEHQFSTSKTDAGWSQLDYDRLRIDLETRAGRNTRASAALIWQIFRGKTEISLRDVLPGHLKSLAPTVPVKIEDRHYLSHICITLHPGPFEITVGKQYLAWGSGMVFNPTELFRPKNLLEPTYEREGVDAISASLPTGSLGDLMIAMIPRGGFRTSSRVIRMRQHLAGFDLSALLAEMHERTGMGFLGGPAGDLERRITAGGDLTGEIFGMGVWLEATYSSLADGQWWEATLGGNYTLPWGTLIALEGYYDGRGKWNDPYPLRHWLGRLTGSRRTLGKGMLFGMVSHQTGRIWTFGMSGLANTGDRSTVLIPSVSCSFAQNVDLLFNGLIFIGRDGTEFGTQNHGGFLRIRAYF